MASQFMRSNSLLREKVKVISLRFEVSARKAFFRRVDTRIRKGRVSRGSDMMRAIILKKQG